ncbi:MAG: DNA polymerase I [Candidatus Eremiobacteraeota bacterium]|nr:DNA polymerase I [Candidatus Eremiobacteraeota bacterium]MBC5827516.1 DNA polymerase I [Candidatus Eremiobacteraeota bacterium]
MSLSPGAPHGAKLLLIDVYSLVYRAFFALPPLSTSHGFPVNAAYGFERMLNKVLRDEKPTHVIACFDAGIPAERFAAVPEYKAQRAETPDDLRTQFPLVRRILDAYGVPAVEVQGEEADDCIATLAARASQDELTSAVVSGDLDLLQLVDAHCTVVVTRRGISDMARYDVEAVRARFGLSPRQLPDYRGLKGDPSDNLPGIPGIGEKTAARLIHEFGSLEALIEHAAELPQRRTAELVRQYADQARRCRQVSLAKRNLAIDISWQACIYSAPSAERLTVLYGDLEFKSLLAKVTDAAAPVAQRNFGESPLAEALAAVQATRAAAPQQRDYKAIATTAELAAVCEAARRCGIVAVTPLPPVASWRAKSPTAFAFSSRPGAAAIAPASLVTGEGAAAFAGLLEDAAIVKAVHGVKGFAGWLLAQSLPAPVQVFDTSVALGLLDPAAAPLALEDAASRVVPELPIVPPDVSEQAPRLFDGGRPPNAQAASAADALLQMCSLLRQAAKSAGLEPLLTDVEFPLAAVLAAMERTGFRLDVAELDRIRAELDRMITTSRDAVFTLAGEEFNLNSPKALGTILFERLALPGAVKTKTGYGTGVDVLAPLAADHPIVAKILEYREVAKLKSTYVDTLPEFVDPSTGRMHTTLRQLGAETGRLSSINPNLQNIPVRSPAGRAIRRAILPATPGNVLLAADYSQIELRLFAHLSQDPAMVGAFMSGEDIHAYTARAVFGLPADERVPAEMRRRAKAVNFGILYGMGSFGLAQSVGFSRAEAKQFIAEYFARFPRARDYIDNVLAQARMDGYVTTILGRRRYLPELQSKNRAVRAAAERMATNAPLQGSAADLIKLAMVRVAARLKQARIPAHLVLQVHDELIFDVPPEHADRVRAEATDAMENALRLRVPIVVDCKMGPNWEQAEAMV